MKLNQQKIIILENEDPINVTSALNVSGGPLVQFYDGVNYIPNRTGSVASPIILNHAVTAARQDGKPMSFSYTTLFYENDVLIDTSNTAYEIIGNSLKVKKNIPGGTAVNIRAYSKFIDPDTEAVYERQDIATLRTIIKAESPYQMQLTQRGVVYFDGYRNPNTSTSVTAVLKKDGEDLTNYSGIIFKWLNSAGLDAIENELYADAYSNGNRTITIDKTYIDHELIRCEAWKGLELIAFDSVTFVRKFNSFRTEIRIPELPLHAGVTTLNCAIEVTDTIGNVDVNAAFLVTWMVTENNTSRQLAVGTPAAIPISSINLKSKPEIWVDLKRREAFAALVTDADELLTDDDDNDNVLTVKTFSL